MHFNRKLILTIWVLDSLNIHSIFRLNVLIKETTGQSYDRLSFLILGGITFYSKLSIIYSLHSWDILLLMLMKFRTSPNLPVDNREGNIQAYPTSWLLVNI